MKSQKSGFTLLEVLIALILFTVGVIAVAGFFSSGLFASSDAENTAIAMNLAQRRMEEIKNFTFANVVDEAKAAVSGFTGFEREVTVSDPSGAPTIADLKDVTVTVYWDVKADEVSVSLRTLISRN